MPHCARNHRWSNPILARSKTLQDRIGSTQVSSHYALTAPRYSCCGSKKRANANHLRYVTCHVDLSSSPKYLALSHSWGSPVPDNALKEIFIHGESVAIRPKLSSFLEIMASPIRDMDLWIDALCINQFDVKELNRQISITGEIYKTAQLVYAWLGPGDDDTSYAMEHVKDSQSRARFDKEIFSASAEKLLRASYWTRRWVI